MGKTAFVFPGQASQYSGMGRDACEGFPEAADVFRRADAALGFPISDMCFSGSDEDLKMTENTQPAILTVSCAVLAALRGLGAAPDYVAGHSLGEYSALVAAGSLSFEDAVVTVRDRGRYMQEAVPVGLGAMAAVMGAGLDVVQAICDIARGGLVLSPANINCPGQIVLAGHKAAVDAALPVAKRKFAKAVHIPVSAPFHCSLMQPAADKLEKDLMRLSFGDPEFPLVNNVDARVVRTGGEARDGLVRQVVGAVLWQRCVETLMAEGIDTYVEVGPKNVLGGMIKKIHRDAVVLAVEKSSEIREVAEKLREFKEKA